MKTYTKRVLVAVAIILAGTMAMVGCGKKADGTPGVAEKTGTAIDNAADKTADAAKSTAEKAKDAAGKAVEKTGEIMEKAGAAVEKTGEDMQD
jgi:ankyrin